MLKASIKEARDLTLHADFNCNCNQIACLPMALTGIKTTVILINTFAACAVLASPTARFSSNQQQFEQQYYPNSNLEEQRFPIFAEEEQYPSKWNTEQQQYPALNAISRAQQYQYTNSPLSLLQEQKLMLAVEQAGCHTLQVPTGIYGTLMIEICPPAPNGCGHVIVKLGTLVDTKVEICKSGQCTKKFLVVYRYFLHHSGGWSVHYSSSIESVQ